MQTYEPFPFDKPVTPPGPEIAILLRLRQVIADREAVDDIGATAIIGAADAVRILALVEWAYRYDRLRRFFAAISKDPNAPTATQNRRLEAELKAIEAQLDDILAHLTPSSSPKP